MTEAIEDYKLKLKYDGQIAVSTGKSRFEKNWKNKKVLWSNLVAKLKTPIRTAETYVEYKKMSKPEQDRVKDVGGYVGGHLKGGHRKSDAVMYRQLITLDLDFAPLDFFNVLEMLSDYACVCYSTHKHSSDTPRFRLLIPLDREVSPDEYEAIARMIASDIGMDYFDDTTYQPSRLMYWPSCSSDGEYFYKYLENPFLKADEILSRYVDWTDISFWPESSRAAVQRKKKADKQGDPCEKPGLIGAFCRTYSIQDAIETFIPEAYIQCENSDRYTYAGGSTAAGLVIYEDNKFAYSNHGTDPISGMLCNAFDLIRIHKFGEQDENAAPDTDIKKLPSYKAMLELIQKDKNTKHTLGRERRENAKADFSEEAAEDDSWMENLAYNKQGIIENTINNLVLILKNDEDINGICCNQLSGSLEIRKEVPWKHPNKYWRDADEAQLIAYLETTYGSFSQRNFDNALKKVADDRAFHPIREYLNNLPEWDEIPRVESLLIDYLGAEDNKYVRAVTRKTLIAAVARIMEPGCKFDNMLVLNGPQGKGKSTLIAKLGGEWFSDSLSLTDLKDSKTAPEKLQGYWIMEIPELAGLKKTEIEPIKAFISAQADSYRAAYGRNVMTRLRQSVFIGTTNAEDGYLRDATGNRRFWPVMVSGKGIKASWDITKEDVQQIWAEAKNYYEAGEHWHLDKEIEVIAEIKQKEAIEYDAREGIVKAYLETLLPKNWETMDIYERHNYIENENHQQNNNPGIYERKQVSYIEIWCEALGKNKNDYDTRKAYELKAILKSIGGWKLDNSRPRVKPYGQQRVYIKEI